MDRDEKYILGEEAAEDQLQLFLDWYDICREDFISSDEGESSSTWYDKITSRLKRAIRKGLVEIKEENTKDGSPTLNVYQTLTRKIPGVESPICYKEISGRAKLALKGSAKTGQFAQIYLYLGGLCGEGEKVFHNMAGRDGAIAECLGFLFLQV